MLMGEKIKTCEAQRFKRVVEEDKREGQRDWVGGLQRVEIVWVYIEKG